MRNERPSAPARSTRRRKPPIVIYLAGLALLATLGAGAAVLAGWRGASDHAEQVARASAHLAAHRAAESIASGIGTLRSETAALAATPGLSGAFTSHDPCSLTFAGTGPFPSGRLLVLRPDGSIACSSAGAAGRYPLSRWRAPVGSSRLIGPLRDPIGGSPSLVAVSAIPGGGAVAGLVALRPVAPTLASAYAGISHPEFLVTTPNGRTALSRSVDPRRWDGRTLAGTPFLADRSDVRPDVDGQVRIYSSAVVHGLGWHVYVGVARATALAGANGVLWDELWVVAAALTIVLLGALLVARRIASPIMRLAAAVAGEVPREAIATLARRPPAEISRLASAFGALEARVKEELGQRRSAEEAARRAGATYRILFEGNPQPMWVFDTSDLSILAVNDAALVHYGYLRRELLALGLSDLFASEDVARLEQSGLRTAVLERLGPWRLQKKDGSLVEVEITSQELVFDGRDARLVVAEDVTDRLADERQLRDLALHDPLTGLANRTVLLDRIARAGAGRDRGGGLVAAVVVDLDRFKDVIDLLGHEGGDQLLREVAARLSRIAGSAVTVGRLTADEFVLVCESLTDEGRAVALAQAVDRAFSEPFLVAGEELHVSASSGVAVSAAARPAEEVLRDAFGAMNRAKAAGGGRYELFDAAIRTRALAKIETERSLRGAAERGELRLDYQPEVDLLTGECRAAEALLRWDHPERGVVAPLSFIPVAEETGLIARIGGWALRQACRQAASWRANHEGPPLVAVNLSAHQLAQPDLVAEVRDVLDETGLSPGSLCLELTESALTRDAEATFSVLSALRDLGVQLSIDDFGTGYSSLLYLRRYPFTSIKIDRLFVAGIESDTRDAAIVSSVVRLGHAFGLAVVAEGVETAAQRGALQAMGCDIGQGFLWSRPVAPGEISTLMASPAMREHGAAPEPSQRSGTLGAG